MPDRDLVSAIEALAGAAPVAISPLAGGDLSTVVRYTLADGSVGIAKHGGHAEAEAAMLRAIRASGAPAPAVIAAAGDLLLIDEVSGSSGPAGAWDDLAVVLHRLHGATGTRYGWDADHAFGAVAIPNGWRDDWPRFWAEHRLRCHLPHIAPELGRRVEALAAGVGDRLPRHPPPALLHGDLWGGNVMTMGARVTGLIDPACYYGHREVDAAMLTLFDSPPPRFFDALALDAGWRERQPLYRLWPLLVHLRLFGDGYLGTVTHTLSDLGC